MGCCNRNSRRRPKISQQARNLALSLANVVAYAKATGKIKAEDTIINQRLSICTSCRHNDRNRCNVCGCFLTVKAGLKAESCPLKKW